jgi:hypothetical protein
MTKQRLTDDEIAKKIMVKYGFDGVLVIACDFSALGDEKYHGHIEGIKSTRNPTVDGIFETIMEAIVKTVEHTSRNATILKREIDD